MKFQERATKLGWGFILQACSSDCQFLFLKFAHVEKEEASIFYLLHCIVVEDSMNIRKPCEVLILKEANCSCSSQMM